MQHWQVSHCFDANSWCPHWECLMSSRTVESSSVSVFNMSHGRSSAKTFLDLTHLPHLARSCRLMHFPNLYVNAYVNACAHPSSEAPNFSYIRPVTAFDFLICHCTTQTLVHFKYRCRVCLPPLLYWHRICSPVLLCRLRHICPETAEAHVHLPVCSVCLDPHDSAGGLHSVELLCEQYF